MREAVKVNDTNFIATGFYEPVYSSFYNMDFKTDTSANLLNFQLHPNVIGIPSLIKSSDNNFVVASTIKEANNDKNIYLYKIDENLQFVPFDTNTYLYDSLCPESIQSGTIDLSDCLVWTGAEEIPSPEEYYNYIATIPISAFPNPAETEITLTFENTDHHTTMLLECFNIYGQQVHDEKIWKGQQETRVELHGWARGLYFVVVKSEGKVAGSCRFVRK
ncbi:MAG: T9SS type A sorting domain-containing protein [Bacteroidetes bacterium]|nr:T9SS type A sorting domain-containing protein [Bacteroidota bacterium]